MHISGLSLYWERVYKTPSFNEKDRLENIGFLLIMDNKRTWSVYKFIVLYKAIKRLKKRESFELVNNKLKLFIS